MKNKNIVYGIIAVLVILGILFIFNKNEEKTEIKKTETVKAVKVLKDGEKEVKNVETKIVNSETNKTEPTKNSEELEEDGIPAKFIAENNLPPYPGKDGGPGILGTDVNDNEIRDDLEREIFWQYRDFPEEVRNVFLSQVVALKRSLDVGIAIKNGEFDKEALIEREKSFEEMAACKSYYAYNKIFGKPIPGFGDTKRYFNTKERLAVESSIHWYGLNGKGYNTSEEDQAAFVESGNIAHEYSAEIDKRMYGDAAGYDDDKARAFCAEISEKYLN